MFKNRYGGRNNISGIKISKLRVKENLSQRELADRLQLNDIDLDKNAIQRIESGQRFVTDIELSALAKLFHFSVDFLIDSTASDNGSFI